MEPVRSFVGVVVGMRSEAALLDGSTVLCSGGLPDKAADLARSLVRRGALALASFGIAGGLDPGLSPGGLVIGTGVATRNGVLEADPAWRRRLAALLPQARQGMMAGAEDAVTSQAAKADLRARSGAIAVDLESAALAAVASEAGLPFAILRAIADPAWRSLPKSALCGLDADGETRPLRVLAMLARRPWELAGLIRLGGDANAALSALGRARAVLDAGLGFEPS